MLKKHSSLDFDLDDIITYNQFNLKVSWFECLDPNYRHSSYRIDVVLNSLDIIVIGTE